MKLHSDSQYLINAVSKGWAEGWRKRGWMRNKGEGPELRSLGEALESCLRHEISGSGFGDTRKSCERTV